MVSHLMGAHHSFKDILHAQKSDFLKHKDDNNSQLDESDNKCDSVYDYFECPKCEQKYASYEKLLKHLAQVHFRVELLLTYSRSDSTCSECADALLAKEEDKLVSIF
jgi:hypothetical protein